MYKSCFQSLFKICILFAISNTANSESALRVACEDSDEGSKIYINGKYKGDCSSALFLPAGNIKLRVVMPVDSEYEKVYENEFYLGDNTAKKVEVSLSAPQLSIAAIKERKRKKNLLEKETASAALVAAKKGDYKAMKSVSQFYEQGTGLAQNSQKAEFWRKKSIVTEQRTAALETLKQAKAGNATAMRSMSQFYAEGKGVKQNTKKAKAWEDKADAIRAEAALQSAKAGNISSMREISRYYSTGTGVNQDTSESKSWNNKAELAVKEKNDRQQQRRKSIKSKAELAKIDFFENTKGAFNWAGEIMRKDPHDDPGGVSSVFLTGPYISTFAAVSDITITGPFNITKVSNLKKDISYRPSNFDKPNSMIAKAYRQKNQY